VPQAYAALIAGGSVLIGRKSMVNVGEMPAPWTNVANGGYQWALPGGYFDAGEIHTNPAIWHAFPAPVPPVPPVQLQAVNAAAREFREETGLVLDAPNLDVAIFPDPGGQYYLVTFTVAGVIAPPNLALLDTYATAYTALAQPLSQALCNAAGAGAAAGAVANVRTQWTTTSGLRGAGLLPVGCSAFEPMCDFEFSELVRVPQGHLGDLHLGVPQTYAGAGQEARIVNYAGGLGGGRRTRLRYTLQALQLPSVVAPAPGVPSPAQAALQIEWWITMAGWL
jgi:8-oxo-dGTP pyrophosphatase MutT (NUDIX family)